jgi:hypothetical protein
MLLIYCRDKNIQPIIIWVFNVFNIIDIYINILMHNSRL